MSDTATTQPKPPVPYTADAIRAGIAHEAANGPSHVRIKALGMMARITGLYEQGKQIARLTAERFAQQADLHLDPATREFYERCEALDGVDLTDLSMFSACNSESEPTTESESETEDEDRSSNDDDEPP